MNVVCINNSNFEDMLTIGKTYKVINNLDSRSGKFFAVKHDKGVYGEFFTTRFKVCETVDNPLLSETEGLSLWDSMEQIEGLDRSTAKSFTYKMMLSGSNPVELAKEYKLSLAQVSQIVLVFNTYTGAE